MKSPILLLSLCVSTIEAHYYWPWFLVNGTQFAQWKFVRDVAGGAGYGEGDVLMAKSEPQIDLYSTNFTCGRNAFASAKKTETADVIAGTEVGFRVNQGLPDKDAEYSGVNHPGPAQVYLAKPPEGVALEDFSGIDADWFKIVYLGQTSDTSWFINSYDHRVVNFTIPANVPPGKYLLRFEQFWPSSSFMETQFFINCAHVNIIGSSTDSGSLEGYPYAKFPGTYDFMDPGIWSSSELANKKGLSKYVPPGPAVWKG